MRVKYIQVRLMHPFPSELVKSMLKDAKTVIDIEMNYTGQLGSLVRQHTGLEANYHIVKYNGRPMSLDEVYNGVKRIIPRRCSKETSVEKWRLNYQITRQMFTTIGARVVATSEY